MKGLLYLILYFAVAIACYSSNPLDWGSEPSNPFDWDSEHATCFISSDYHGKVVLYRDSLKTDTFCLYTDTLYTNQTYYLALIKKDSTLWKAIVRDPLSWPEPDEIIGEFWYDSTDSILSVLTTANTPLDLPLILFENPDYNIIDAEYLFDYAPEMEVIDFHDLWLKVRFTTLEGNYYEGWIMKSQQCAEAYSSCCG